MRRFASLALLAALLAAIGFLLLETKQLAEQLGRAEIDLRQARTAALAAGELAAEQQAAAAASQRRVVELQTELLAAAQQAEATLEIVRQRAAAEAQRQAAAAASAEALRAPIPEGVRQCLLALQDCLRLEGYASLRFLSARALVDSELRDVELLWSHGDGLDVEFLRAGRMTAELDRAAQCLRLCFFDGEHSRNGNREALPAAGHELRFEPIDGRLFEARLPYLLQAVGEHPPAATRPVDRPRGNLDPIARAQWFDRFDRLLAAAGTPERLRLNSFRSLQEASFGNAQLLGTDDKRLLVMSADCQQLAVEVNTQTGTVSLWLRNGVLRRGGAESTIDSDGYRMLLPKITPAVAREIMLGMVVER